MNDKEIVLSEEVLAIARLMQFKIDKNKHKECATMNPDGKGRHWSQCSVKWLSGRLMDEFKEMQMALEDNETPEEIAKECADVCNFAMMIADNVGGLKSKVSVSKHNPAIMSEEVFIDICKKVELYIQQDSYKGYIAGGAFSTRFHSLYRDWVISHRQEEGQEK